MVMYGENGALLRSGLSDLLRHHRVQLHLGGPGPNRTPATTSAEERVAAGLLLQTYRRGVLTWCHQIALGVDPYLQPWVARGPQNPFAAAERDLAPLDALTRALETTLRRGSAALPSLDQLTTRQPIPLVESWRHLARAAAMAEHDLDPAQGVGLGAGRLTVPQARTVVADVAAITQALVVLDRRYRRVPGWKPLRQADRLGWAALACALDASLAGPDYSVDQRGWRPPVKTIKGPAKPGILGVLQAEHNLLIRLRTFPATLNLRLVLDSQRLISAGLANLVAPLDEQLSATWHQRAVTYRRLHVTLRNISSLVGKGGLAAAEGGNAVTRLARIPSGTVIEPRAIAGFSTLFTGVDAQIAAIIEHAVTHDRYLERAPLPHVDAGTAQTVQQTRGRFEPMSASTRHGLLMIVRDELAIAPGAITPSRMHQTLPDRHTRANLHAALVHQPTSGRPHPTLSM